MRKPPPPASLSRSSFVQPCWDTDCRRRRLCARRWAELRRVGVNLNQLRLANTTGDMPTLAELRAIRGVLEAAMRSALDL